MRRVVGPLLAVTVGLVLADSAVVTLALPDILRERQEEGMRLFPIILDKHEWNEHRWLKSTDFLPGRGKTIGHDYKAEEDLKRLF